VSSIYLEFGLVALGAMFSPTTLTVTVLALVLGEHPKRTGFWFFVGAFGITVVIGIVAAFVIGNDFATPSHPSTPKTWVAIVDVVAGGLLIAFVVRAARRPPNPKRMESMMSQMAKVASSPAIAVIAAGATLANPGGFIPLALKEISELNPSTSQYAVLWIVFTVASLLPLIVALVMLVVAPEPAERALNGARAWLDRNVRMIAGAIILLLAASLLSHGIAGLTS
jgi:4-amino-4-deoxy-L-arabinose transferase-like glycosyltransferase